jgi:hypothetical protein
MKLIVFVCVSNTCRSPMCEYLLRDKLQKAGVAEQFHVVSRSLSEAYEPQGSPANEQGQLVRYFYILLPLPVCNTSDCELAGHEKRIRNRHKCS